MEGIINYIVFLAVVPVYVQATIICGDLICNGYDPYCCGLDSGEEGCCWGTRITDTWWFWFVWVCIFFLILGCSGAYWRRRRRVRRLAVLANSQYPAYGTVIHGAPPNSHTGLMNPAATVPSQPPFNHPNMHGAQAPPSYDAVARTATPSYAASGPYKNEKPPAYSA